MEADIEELGTKLTRGGKCFEDSAKIPELPHNKVVHTDAEVAQVTFLFV
jgi:hypothetical protein